MLKLIGLSLGGITIFKVSKVALIEKQNAEMKAEQDGGMKNTLIQINGNNNRINGEAPRQSEEEKAEIALLTLIQSTITYIREVAGKAGLYQQPYACEDLTLLSPKKVIGEPDPTQPGRWIDKQMKKLKTESLSLINQIPEKKAKKLEKLINDLKKIANSLVSAIYEQLTGGQFLKLDYIQETLRNYRTGLQKICQDAKKILKPRKRLQNKKP